MSFVDFNLEEYPVLYITFKGAPSSKEEMISYLAKFQGYIDAAAEVPTNSDAADNARGVGLVIDMGEMSMGDSVRMLTYAPMQIEFIQSLHKNHLVDSIVATAIVVRSDIARSVVEWVLRAVPLQRPVATVTSAEEGRTWIQSNIVAK